MMTNLGFRGLFSTNTCFIVLQMKISGLPSLFSMWMISGSVILHRRGCFLWPSHFNPDVCVPPYHFRYWSVRFAARNLVEPSRFEHKHCHWASRRVSSFPQGEDLATESNYPWCSHCRPGDAALGQSPFLSKWHLMVLSDELALSNSLKMCF